MENTPKQIIVNVHMPVAVADVLKRIAQKERRSLKQQVAIALTEYANRRAAVLSQDGVE